MNGTNSSCPAAIPGFTLKGADCELLCRPTRWIDVVAFFLGNYAAHAATVVSRPGQSTLTTILAIASALLLPGLGVRNGVGTIWSRATLGKTSLRQAARAGALCAVVRIPQEETDDEAAEGPLRESRERNPLFATTKVHGLCRLPEGYELVIVHWHATCVDDEVEAPRPPPSATPWPQRWSRKLKSLLHPEPEATVSLSSSYNLIKAVISMVQLGLAISTLYRARGDQLARYGYAAFGLTVSPYAWMSLVNLFGNLMCPQYDCVFVVGSDGLDHLQRRLETASAGDRRRFGVTGLVGRLDRVSDQHLQALRREGRAFGRRFRSRALDVSRLTEVDILTAYLFNRWLANRGRRRADPTLPPQQQQLETDVPTAALKPGALLLGRPHNWAAVVPVVLVGALSLFQPGRSTTSERVWTMTWLAFGVFGVIFESPAVRVEGRPVIGGADAHRLGRGVYYMLLVLVYSIASIGGLVTVGKMVMEFGVCERL